MRFPSSLNDNVKIRLAPGVSKFVADCGSLFIKYDNRLFRLSSSSDIEKRSRILDILEEPKKLIEITNILGEFRRNDLIVFLRNLYKLNLVELEEPTPQYNIKSGASSNGSSAAYTHQNVNSMTARGLVGNKILLIGDGFLTNNLAAYFRSVGIQYDKLSSFDTADQHSDQMTPNNIKKTQRKQLGECGLLSFHRPSFSDEYDLIVAAQDYPNIMFFETVNKICFNKKKPWLRVSVDDNIGFLGPLVIPGQTSCYDCCELRLVTNSPYYEYFLWKYKEHIPKARLSPSKLLVDILSSLCASEIFSHLTKASKPETISHLFLLDLRQIGLSKHKIVPYPSCAYCNVPWTQKHTLSKLRTTSKGQLTRNDSPKGPAKYMVPQPASLSTEKELLQKLKELEDEKTGMVSKSEKLFDSNILGIKFHHFYDVTCYNPLRIGLTERFGSDVLLSKDNLIEPAPSGSGFSATEAETSALMEALERYSSRVIEVSRLIWSSYVSVKKRAINPSDLILYPDECYDRAGFKCSRYSPASEYPWIEGLDVFSGKPVLVPADFVFYPPFREKPLVLETSNGAAAHSDIVQATLNGLYEVIERDSFLIMWLNKLSMPILDVKQLPFGFDESVKRMNELGMDVKLVQIVNDTNIPTVMAVCYNKSQDKYPAMVVGTASHIEPDIAIKKALFEMEFQLINHLENPMKSKILHPDQISASYEHPIFYLNPENRKHCDFLISSDKRAVLPTFARRKTKDDHSLLMRIVRLLNKMNNRVVQVDITPPDIKELGLHIVKVLVTGFQPLYFRSNMRLSLERLYTVPPRLGFGTTVRGNWSDLNPAPHPLP